ncbi:MAG: DUF2232 domain-containing protein [Actinomycetota bacterium]|nr:DUF2232 domain-containing protein [Actinomycetota bacterium]
MDERGLPAGSLAIFTILAIIALILIPFWSVTLALAPIPVYLATKQRGRLWGGAVLMIMGAATAALMGWAAVPATMVLLGLGYLPGLMGPSGRPGRRLAAAAIFLIFVFFGLGALAYLSDRAETAKVMAQQSAIVREQVLKQAAGQSQTPGLRAELDKLIAVMPYILFGIAALSAIWLAWLNYFITGRLARRWGFDWTPLPEFSRWQISWVLAYGFIFGLIGSLFSRSFGAYWPVAYGVGIGLLLVFGALYFVQGLAVIKFFADKNNFGPMGTVFIIVIGLLVQLVFQGLSWLGLFDTWFDFRKLASSG